MSNDETDSPNATLKINYDDEATCSNRATIDNMQKVDTFERVELPPFWTQKVQLWFVAIEAQFASRRITADSSKYFAVIARLDQDTLSVVENLVTNPPATDKYSAIKEALLSHFSVSQERQFKTLISGLELGCKRPSALLAEINRLGGNLLDATFIRTMWIDRLPQHVQVALAAAEGLSNDKLAQLADKIMDIQQANHQHQLFPVAQRPIGKDNDNNNLQDITKIIFNLCNKLDNFIMQSQSQRSRSHSRSNSLRTQSESRHNLTHTICYYHKKFGVNANKCRQPCTWHQPTTENSENANNPQ